MDLTAGGYYLYTYNCNKEQQHTKINHMTTLYKRCDNLFNITIIIREVLSYG